MPREYVFIEYVGLRETRAEKITQRHAIRLPLRAHSLIYIYILLLYYMMLLGVLYYMMLLGDEAKTIYVTDLQNMSR